MIVNRKSRVVNKRCNTHSRFTIHDFRFFDDVRSKGNFSFFRTDYLALARDEGIPLITSDQGIYNAVRKDIQWVKWLGDI